jgi:2-oxoglutarate dehydrogenase E1 component
MDFRREFGRDVVIDMFCYRRWGHNEGDEPAFTQPLLYEAIERRKSVPDNYREHLLALGGVTADEVERLAQRRRELLEADLSQSRSADFVIKPTTMGGAWEGYFGGQQESADAVETGVALERLASLLERLTVVPDDFHLHRKLQRGIDARRAMARGELPLDWSTAEALALASLATEGVRVRLSGQDSQRVQSAARRVAAAGRPPFATFNPRLIGLGWSTALVRNGRIGFHWLASIPQSPWPGSAYGDLQARPVIIVGSSQRRG